MSERTERPGGWVDGIGWVARLGDCRRGDQVDADGDGGSGIVTGINVDDPTPVIVTRWADGEIPTPPAAPGTEGADE